MQRITSEITTLFRGVGSTCRDHSSFQLFEQLFVRQGASQSIHHCRNERSYSTPAQTDLASATGQSVRTAFPTQPEVVTGPTLTSHQAKRIEIILAKRKLIQKHSIRNMMKKRCGEDLELPVHDWHSLVLRSTAGQAEMNQPAPVSHNTATLPAKLFNAPVNPHTLYQVIRWQLAKRRAGTASTKTRSEVSGGGKKPWNQKGSGRARQGSIRAPQWRGGGIVFGPRPRDFSYPINKMVRRSGLRAALCAKAAQGKIIIVDQATLSDPEVARNAFRLQLLQHVHLYRDLDLHKSRVAGLGLRSRIIEALTRNAQSELPSPVPAPAAGEPDNTSEVVDGIISGLESQGWDTPQFAAQNARTGVFKQTLQHLLPNDWDAQPESVQMSNKIVEMMSNGVDEERRIRLETQRKLSRPLSVLIMDSAKDGKDGGVLLRRSVGNLPYVDALPVAGANVYDIVRHNYLVITVPALEALIERLTRPINRKFKPAGYTMQKWVQEEETKKQKELELAQSFPAWLAERKAELAAQPQIASQEM